MIVTIKKERMKTHLPDAVIEKLVNFPRSVTYDNYNWGHYDAKTLLLLLRSGLTPVPTGSSSGSSVLGTLISMQ